MSNRSSVLWLLITLVGVACDTATSAAVDAASVDAPSTDATTEAPSVDCIDDGPCPDLLVDGDPYATGPARGYADPSLRQDPQTGRLWLAYSWPHAGNGGVHVDAHLAHSDDDGETWSFDRMLWQSEATTDPRTGASGFLNQETVSLTARSTATGTRWVAARMQYFRDTSPDVRSFTVRIVEAASPPELASAPEQILGGALLDAAWPRHVDLASLAPDLSDCTFFDAGVLFAEERLYMAVQCIVYGGGGSSEVGDPSRAFIALFVTEAVGPATSWTWSYLGPLTTPADAAALGAELLMQSELAPTRDGSYVLIATPSRRSSPLAAHDGCRAIGVAALDPPSIERVGAVPLVRATAMASLTGTGSCGYDPSSTTGIVVARRTLGAGVLISELAQSGLHP
jgi:hypothetical protein